MKKVVSPARRRFAPVFAAASVVAVGMSSHARGAITYSISGTWPGTSATAYGNAATAIANDLNAYGNFGSRNIDVAYVSGVPTAQSGYQSQIQVGGSYSDSLQRRVLQHETNHNFGSGTTSNWTNKFNSAGVWTGSHMTQLVAQFDGDGAVIHQSGVHFYPYGLNYDTEVTDIDSAIGAETVYMRNIALSYAQRQDDGLGAAGNPWSAATATLKQSDALGTSAFNNWGVWSDNYFAHAGAAYSTGDFLLRTPLDTYGGTTPSFTFAGDSLTINNTNGISGGLLFKGSGATSVLTIHNLTLNGGYVRHASGAGDLFQLAGNVTLSGAPTIDAAQGNINILAPIGGSGSLTKAGGFTLALLGSNTYSGATDVTAGTLLLNNNSLPNTAGVSVSSAATLLAKGNVSIAGTLNSSGTVSLADGTVSTLTVGGGVNLSNATINLDLGSASADQIIASSAANVSGTNTINISPVLGQGMTNGTAYTIVSAGGGGLSASNFVMGSKAASLGFYQFTLATPAVTALQVTVTGNPTPAVAYWTGQASVTAGDAANKWGTGPSINKSNWSTNAAGTADPLQLPGSTTAVIFNAASASGSAGTLTTQLDSTYVIASLTFDVPSGPGITSAVLNTNANALTIGSGGITVASTSNAAATISGSGSVVVNGDQSWANHSNSRGLSVSSVISALSGPTTLTFNGAGTGGVNLSGVIADGGGTMSLVFNQAGATVLSAINTYSGSTTISSGTVQISGTGKIASSATVGSGATLMLNGGTDAVGDANTITVQSGGTLDIRAAIAGSAKTETIAGLDGGGTVTRGNSGATTLTVGAGNADSAFAGVIQNGGGTMALVKIGIGTLALSGANAYSGGTTVNDNGGALLVTNAGALGSGVVNIGNGNTNQDGVLRISGGIGITSVPTINFESRNTSDADGSADIENVSGSNSLSANFNINTTGGNAVNIVSTSGKLALSGNMTSTGLSTPRGFDFYGAGDGVVSGSISNGSAQPTFVQMDGPGTWTLSGANSYTSTTTVNGGRLVISGANSGAGTSTAVNAGTLTLSNATALGAAANVQFPATSTGTLDLALSAGSDVPYTIGTNTTSNITVQSDVATPGPGVTHSTGAWTLGGGSIAIQAGPNVTGGAPALSIPSVNLTAGSTQTTTFIPTTASVTIGTVSNGSAQAHTLALDGTASGNVITGAISASQGTLNVTKSNTSTWTLSGNNTYNGTTSVSGGTLTIDAAGSMSGTSYTVAAGATLNVNGLIPTNSTITTSGTAAFGGNGGATTSTRSVGTLTVNAGGLAKISASAFPFTPVILRLGTLSFTNSSAKLDLANNATIATGTAGGALSLIANGQIFSSQAADANFAIGYTDLSGADAGKYEARYTLKGDANLDGAVDVGDLGALATSYGVTGGRSWVNGDFNRDGNVDVADLGALATNYGTQLAAGPAFDGSTVAVPTALAAGGVAVPEPASLGVLVFGAIGLTRRHRRGSEKERG